MPTERAITERLRTLSRIPPGSNLILGIGDDCAIYRPAGKSPEDLLFTADLIIEDVHFRRQTHKPADIGRIALARSLSDIAAMGGSPRFCLVSLCIPEWAKPAWVHRFFASLTGLAYKSGAILAGGDLSHGATFACDVTVCGAVPQGQALLRSGARPGDRIYVSGQLGGSALGLAKGPGRGAAWNRHIRPEPRIELGQFLRTTLHATSAIDLSDGLSLDLERLCLASEVAAALDQDPPRFRGASVEHALHGGEDYELLFTVPARTRVPENFGPLPLTRIGSIVEGVPGQVRHKGEPLPPNGYDHFKQ